MTYTYSNIPAVGVAGSNDNTQVFSAQTMEINLIRDHSMLSSFRTVPVFGQVVFKAYFLLEKSQQI